MIAAKARHARILPGFTGILAAEPTHRVHGVSVAGPTQDANCSRSEEGAQRQGRT
jgi:hypothetical protein